MTDRPILFNADMIRALLDGRKTQTRRLLNPQPPEQTYFKSKLNAQSGQVCVFEHPLSKQQWKIPLRVQLNDRLWVREAWRVGAWQAEHWARGDTECDASVALDYLADGQARQEWLKGKNADQMLRLMNQSRQDAEADGHCICDDKGGFRWKPGESPCRIRPSIHMPRWANRLTLIVTDVRVQRLQDISEADAMAEGIERLRSGRGFYDPTMAKGAIHAGHYFTRATDAFATLWASVYGSEAWDANPWVSATTFTVHRCNIDQMEAA